MALALAPRIRVNGIGPGPALPNTRQTPEQFARQSASVPLHRGTSPDEIARAVLAILALPAMTGQMLALDGGQHLQWQPGRHGPPPEESEECAWKRQPIASSARALRHMFLRDLVLAASIGVHPHEHAAPQRVRINVDLGGGGRWRAAVVAQPVGRDELARVVDYEKLAERVRGDRRRRPCPAG